VSRATINTLEIMKEKKQNEELQSRREFFKKSAKKALPILGAIMLAGMPNVAEATGSYGSKSGCTQCSGTCTVKCGGSCYGGCTGTCTVTCGNSCVHYCTGTCKVTCGNNTR